MFWAKNQIDVKLGNNGRPVVSKLLKPFDVLWRTSQVEGNSRYEWLCFRRYMSKFFDNFRCIFGLGVYDSLLLAG